MLDGLVAHHRGHFCGITMLARSVATQYGYVLHLPSPNCPENHLDAPIVSFATRTSPNTLNSAQTDTLLQGTHPIWNVWRPT
eukprot:6847776-Alexandrium_andersonii.AAC.1